METPESFRDTLYTIGESGERNWVYSNVIIGRFMRLRAAVAYGLMAIYLVTPWIQIRGQQAVLLNLYDRKFTILGTDFWATDSLYLMLSLMTLGASLFFFTALFGRVWCGWACPETVFLEFLFRPIERLIEGNATQRKRLDEKKWTLEKVTKKLLKHALCAAAAWVLSTTMLAYFFGAHRMIAMILEGPQNHLLPFGLTVVFMGLFAFQFGWFREQFCTLLCPYARLQSVMLDPNSLVIGYDVTRGEPRGKATSKTTGDCVDCGLCVRVCPTGIDIRNGLQLECVNCAACIDACDSIMDNVGRARGLIRYDTENKLLGRPSRFLRPRVLVYSILILGIAGFFFYSLVNREYTEFQVMRESMDRPFTILPDGRVMNHFHLRISNKGRTDEAYVASVESSEASVNIVIPLVPYPVKSGDIATIPVFLQFPIHVLHDGKAKVQFELNAESGFHGIQEVTILGPSEEDEESEDER